MKVYTKPDFTIFHYDVKDYVAACENPTTYDPVHVDCVIKSGSQDAVFYNDGLGICSYYATSNNLFYYKGNASLGLEAGYYLYWYGESDGNPNNQIMNELLAASHASQFSSGGAFHAGPASADVHTLINQST